MQVEELSAALAEAQAHAAALATSLQQQQQQQVASGHDSHPAMRTGAAGSADGAGAGWAFGSGPVQGNAFGAFSAPADNAQHAGMRAEAHHQHQQQHQQQQYTRGRQQAGSDSLHQTSLFSDSDDEGQDDAHAQAHVAQAQDGGSSSSMGVFGCGVFGDAGQPCKAEACVQTEVCGTDVAGDMHARHGLEAAGGCMD